MLFLAAHIRHRRLQSGQHPAQNAVRMVQECSKQQAHTPTHTPAAGCRVCVAHTPEIEIGPTHHVDFAGNKGPLQLIQVLDLDTTRITHKRMWPNKFVGICTPQTSCSPKHKTHSLGVCNSRQSQGQKWEQEHKERRSSVSSLILRRKSETCLAAETD
jgi:hypothetical protein